MPYAHFPEDRTSVWFETNFPLSGEVAQLDSRRQTVLLLPYIGLDITSFSSQFQDPILSQNYNLLAVDFRSQGQTINDPQEPHDCWVNAAGLLKLLARLQIPEVHVFANGALSIGTALRMVLLWPTGILSLGIVSVHKHLDDWLVDTFKELTVTFATARSLEEIEDIINELIPYLFYDGLPEKELDFFASYLMKQYPPTRITRFNDMLFAFRTQWLEPLTRSQLKLIKQPFIIIQPEDVLTCDRESAEALQRQLASSTRYRLHSFDTPAAACYFTSCSSAMVNAIYTTFLEGMHCKGAERETRLPNMDVALQSLAILMGKSHIGQRDPQRVISFNCVSSQDVAEEMGVRGQLGMIEQTAFNPLLPNGELPRKFSERHNQNFFGSNRKMSASGEWLYAAIDIHVGKGEHIASDNEIEVS